MYPNISISTTDFPPVSGLHNESDDRDQHYCEQSVLISVEAGTATVEEESQTGRNLQQESCNETLNPTGYGWDSAFCLVAGVLGLAFFSFLFWFQYGTTNNNTLSRTVVCGSAVEPRSSWQNSRGWSA